MNVYSFDDLGQVQAFFEEQAKYERLVTFDERAVTADQLKSGY